MQSTRLQHSDTALTACIAAFLAACVTVHGSGRTVAPEAACTSGQVAGDACLYLPLAGPAPAPLVVFLHGMFAASAPAGEERQEELLVARATRRGFAVLVPRGRRGLCDWKPELADFVCWPTTPRHVAEAEEIVRSWRPALEAASARLGAASPLFLLGFSNGGFFAALVAGQGLLPLRGLAVLHGGALAPVNFALVAPIPTLLLGAESDRWQLPKLQQLHEWLEAARWPHTLRVRPGQHGLTAQDLDDALDLFASAVQAADPKGPP